MQGKIGSFFLVVALLGLTGCLGPGKGTLLMSNRTDDVLKISYDGPIFGYVNVKPNSSKRVKIVVGEYFVSARKAGNKEARGSQLVQVGGGGAHIVFGGKTP